MPERELSDEALAERAQGGCVASYEQLDRRFRARLIHLLRPRCTSEADAEDAAQQALWTAWRKIEQYDPKRRFSTWLFTIAIRKAIDAGRRRQRSALVSGELTEGAADDGPGPMERAIRREETDHVWTLARQVLSDRQWTALWLTYGEEQGPAEVATALSISRVNARVLLHRARKALAAALSEADQPRPAAALRVAGEPI